MLSQELPALNCEENPIMNAHATIEERRPASEGAQVFSLFPGPTSRPVVSVSSELEHLLLQFQRREALGRAALGVAHEFNNLLGIITGYADLLRVRPELDDEVRADLREIVGAASRAGALAHQLLRFGHDRPNPNPRSEFCSVVHGMRHMLQCLVGRSIQLSIFVASTPCVVAVQAGEIEQVLLNLVGNARDAIDSGGEILVAAGPVILTTELYHQHGTVPAGAYGRLVVTDNGCGMDAETQMHLFEAFYTTKEPGKGTGLGLAIVQTLLQQSNGYIALASEIGGGSIFEVYWPLLSEHIGKN